MIRDCKDFIQMIIKLEAQLGTDNFPLDTNDFSNYQIKYESKII